MIISYFALHLRMIPSQHFDSVPDILWRHMYQSDASFGRKAIIPPSEGKKMMKTHSSIRQIITGMSYPVFIKDFIWYWITRSCPIVSWQALSPSVFDISLNNSCNVALVLYWLQWGCHAGLYRTKTEHHRSYTKCICLYSWILNSYCCLFIASAFHSEHYLENLAHLMCTLLDF